ncbi:imidazole glycerol phosphate synthase subunit HisH [Halorussus salinus]|uniref:imidazole glycerol phosphate synthase subunit HisH n=1 Tax=Halorussus salinus TaxID=1364935 RepID=UPI0010919214|nr:imidazole glycerol phosphate synthase subunit HisH [Halorussus salinus]
MNATEARDPEETGASVVVVDYGLGNLRSVTRGLERAGATVTVSDDPETFASADGVVLPGVGAFREGVENAGPYRAALLDAADRGTPVFGICLGMQMLLTTSEEAERTADSSDGHASDADASESASDGAGGHAGERAGGHAGDVRGLDLIPGTNVRFADGQKVPHMGWNELDVKRDHPLVDGVDGEYAYFVHSYYAVPDDPEAVVATSDYGTAFPAVVANDEGTVFGTQFHPEKSGETGLRLLRNFVDICTA